MRDIWQKPTESEIDYSARLNQAEIRCGNVHPIAKKITIFVRGLNPAIEPLITRVREGNPSRSYIELVQIARDHGGAFRAGGGNDVQRHPLLQEKPTVGTRNTRSSALLASSADNLWGHEGLGHAFEINVNPLQMMTEARRRETPSRQRIYPVQRARSLIYKRWTQCSRWDIEQYLLRDLPFRGKAA